MSDLSTSDLRRRSLWAFSTLCGLNFVVFFIVALVIGGDAVNGKVVGGLFYLSDHGKLTEVSEAVYTYSLWHVRSLFLTHALAMLFAALAKRESAGR